MVMGGPVYRLSEGTWYHHQQWERLSEYALFRWCQSCADRVGLYSLVVRDTRELEGWQVNRCEDGRRRSHTK